MFGVPTRPSTPIFDLLEHKYQKIWVKEQAHKQDKAKEAAKVGHRVGKVNYLSKKYLSFIKNEFHF